MKKASLFIAYVFFLCLFLLVLFLVFDYLYPLDTAKLHRPQSYVVRTDKGEILRLSLSKDEFWRFDATKEEIPNLLKKSVLLFEDRYFYYHFGINPFSIFRSFIHNIKEKRLIGASTISMQVARMMQRRPRNYVNKLKEMFTALQLEWHYTKEDILLFYLNLAPYGGNIEGIKAASYFYFQKKLHALTTAQIALLTTIPKNPNMNRLDKQKSLHVKKDAVLLKLYKNNLISKSSFLRAKIEPMQTKRFHAPFHAPHFTNIAFKRGIHTVFLDTEIQHFIEKILREAIHELKNKHVYNAAAVLIDNKTMRIKAYVGSNDFYGFLGQNDGVRALRSPGSTLKPFIYAKALEKGFITPKKELFDVPLSIGFWEPENFSKMYMGVVSASEALQYSLNIPAIILNNLLDKASLYEILKKAKIHSIDKKKEYYGNALALGGFGISLLDLTHLYTAFANKGTLFPLYVNNSKDDKPISLLSSESAWLVSEILSQALRPQFSSFWESNANIPKVGFKTGTSADFKDLYTIGFSKEYTLGVWMGNFDGKSTDEVTGIQAASKTVFRVFRYLNAKKPLTWMQKPQKIKEVLICLDALQTSTCKRLEYDYVIEGVGLRYPCEILKEEVFAYLLEQKNINSMNDFVQNPCYTTWKELPPAIIYPYNNAELIIKKNKNSKIMLKCYSFTQDQKIYFKIDKKELLQAKSAQEFFVHLSQGHHSISCLDSSSRAVTHTVTIKEE